MSFPTVRPTIDGLRLREKPIDGKPIGQAYVQSPLESLESPAETLRKLGIANQWLHVRTESGLIAYAAAQFLTAVNIPDTDEAIYLTSKIDGLRLREKPVDGIPVGQAYIKDRLKSLESDEATHAKLGQANQWLQVRNASGLVAYAAAQFLTIAADKPEEPAAKIESTALDYEESTPIRKNFLGVNLDAFHTLGIPSPARLGSLGWVRFGYNVSMGKGSQDIEAAYRLYLPLVERYAQAGYRVMFTFTHQTYGEGIDAYWPWSTMTDRKWRVLTGHFTEMIGRIVAQYAGRNLVHAWQIWNEQDAHIGAVASVPMTPGNYAFLLSQSIKTIRAIDSDAAIITGGHTRGPLDGANYARSTIQLMESDVLPDGIAFHPYGRGTTPGDRYCNWGHIDESLKAYTSILPDKPVWITEWGALDKEGDPARDVRHYAKSFIDHLQTHYPGKVAAAIWYAWAMGMHNGYGLVGRDDKPLQPLHDAFLNY